MRPLSKHAVGMVAVGEDAIVVSAVVAGASVTWETTRLAGAFAPAGAPPETAALAAALAPARGPRVLVIPADAMLRRDIELGGRDIADLLAAVRENLDAFLPSPPDDRLLWDLAPMGTRAWLGAAREADLAPTLTRLADLGLAPSRVVPSGLAWSIALRAAEFGGPEPASSVLEETPTGWALHGFEGVEWTSSRAGTGAATERALAEAERRTSLRRRWISLDDSGAQAAEQVALGGAMLGAWPLRSPEAPRFSLLPHADQRRLEVSPFFRWAAVAVIASGGLVALSSAAKDRAASELAALEAGAREAKAGADAVERMRKSTDSLIAGHDRLWRLESRYIPRWTTLAALSAAVPKDAWAERLEITDTSFVIDLVGKGPAEVVRGLENAGFEGVKQASPEIATEIPGETRFRIEGRITAKAVSGAGPAKEGGA